MPPASTESVFAFLKQTRLPTDVPSRCCSCSPPLTVSRWIGRLAHFLSFFKRRTNVDVSHVPSPLPGGETGVRVTAPGTSCSVVSPSEQTVAPVSHSRDRATSDFRGGSASFRSSSSFSSISPPLHPSRLPSFFFSFSSFLLHLPETELAGVDICRTLSRI